MKTTVIANINGFAFKMDEDAYALLENYLRHLAQKLGSSDEAKETVADIEARIGELFSHTHNSEYQSIELDEVKTVIKTIGDLDEFEAAKGSAKSTPPPSSNTPPIVVPKKFYRNVDNRVIGGVCGGISAYFDLEPLMVRVIVLILFMVGLPFVFLGYMIAWIVLPAARTFEQKMEMLGSLKEVVDEKGKVSYQKSVVTEDGKFTKTFKIVARAVAIAFGVILSLVAFALLLSSLTLVTIVPQLDIEPIASVYKYFSFNVMGETPFYLALIGTFLLIFIPAIYFLYLGVKLIKPRQYKVRYLGVLLIILWSLGWVLLVSAGVRIGNQFAKECSNTVTKTLIVPKSNTIYLNSSNNDSIQNILRASYPSFPKLIMWAGGFPKIELERGDSLRVTVKQSAHGSDEFQALDNAKVIEYNYSQNDSVLILDPRFVIPSNSRVRAQKVEVTITVPYGKELIIDEMISDCVQNNL